MHLKMDLHLNNECEKRGNTVLPPFDTYLNYTFIFILFNIRSG